MDQKRGSVAGRKSAAYYRRLLREQEASGRSLRAFALGRGLSPWTLYGWRRRLGRSGRRRRGGRVTRKTAGFVAVDVVEAVEAVGSGIEVVLADGVRLRLPGDLAIERVAELVVALRSC